MKVSVLIVEYRCMPQVYSCVESIAQHLAAIEHEVLVVSNSCYTEPEFEGYSRTLTSATLIRAQRNLGYAGGVNLGLEAAEGDFIYLLNPDVLLTDAHVATVIKLMAADPDWALAGPRVVDLQGVVQPSCRRFPRWWTFLLVRTTLSKLNVGRVETDRYLMKDFDRLSARPVDWISGGAIIGKTAALREIGGMDTRYFLYMEDVDLCLTAWTLGYRVQYRPETTVIHAGQHQSIAKVSLKNNHLRWHLQSLWRFFRKHGASPARGI